MVTLISRQRGGLAALKLTKLFRIDDFPAANDSGKVLIIIIYCYLRRLERVFRCYIVCETKEDCKEGCLMVWENYMSPCNSIVELYFKGTCDVISVTMETHKVHKSVL